MGWITSSWKTEVFWLRISSFWSEFLGITTLKINMEPKNHPIEHEIYLPNLHDFGFKMLIFQGV